MAEGQCDVRVYLESFDKIGSHWLIARPAPDLISECRGALVFTSLGEGAQVDGVCAKLNRVGFLV